MKPVVCVALVGLTPRSIGERTPALAALASRGAFAPMSAVLPAVTCTAQATMLTGLAPDRHGAVANGWLARESGEVALWRQANALVSGEKIYTTARRRDPKFTCAKIFWWWNLGADVEWSITPRPFYPADGRKIPAVYSSPTTFAEELERDLGPFPFFDFWGPKAGLPSSRWIADAAIKTLEKHAPTLTLVYLPHLDYDFQRFGPDHPRSRQALTDLDQVFRDLSRAAQAAGAEIIAVSEYGIAEVDTPVDINRALRRAGLLAVRKTPAGDVLDTFASDAFALADHQIAHVYTRSSDATRRAADVLGDLAGVERVMGTAEKQAAGLDHPRSGDLVAIAEKRAWFTYYYWERNEDEPDFARTVDIHRKPGYDPCEMFLDPTLSLPKLHVARRLVQKKLGMRYLMDVIPIDAKLVRGSHGRLPDDPSDGPVFLSSRSFAEVGGEPKDGRVAMTSVPSRILALLERSR